MLSIPAPFSTDPEAIECREKCDYSHKITMEDALSGKALPRKIRVYADGVFDLFHLAHSQMFQQAKNFFGPNVDVYLIVGMSNDADVHSFKGITVMSDEERYETVRHCKYVDEVLKACPWTISDEFLEENKVFFASYVADLHI